MCNAEDNVHLYNIQALASSVASHQMAFTDGNER